MAAQGSEWVAAQIYHDAFVGYAFGRNRTGQGVGNRLGSRVTDGLSVQLGVRNVFDRWPPLDAFDNTVQLYSSPYGDARLRSYWVNVKKAF